MLSTKKTNSSEFLLHSKHFNIDYTPNTYFEVFKYDLILQKLIFWFFQTYGLYFFVSKLKVKESSFLLQLFYYKTYFFSKQFIKAKRLQQLEAITLKIGEATVSKPLRLVASSFFGGSAVHRISEHFLNKRKLSSKRRRAKLPLFQYLFFFQSFFLEWFQTRVYGMYKPLWKWLQVLPQFNTELKQVLFKTVYIRQQALHFDLLFFINSAICLYNLTFLLPFFIVHLLNLFNHLELVRQLVKMLSKLYIYKRIMQGAVVVVAGPYNRHGRSRIYQGVVGYIVRNTYHSRLVYDMIHCPTFFGMISLKIWVYYRKDLQLLQSTYR